MSHYYFFLTVGPATTTRRKSFNPVLKKMTSLGLQPFLTYPAVIKLRHKGEQRMFDSPQKAEDFISSLSQKKTYAYILYKAMGKQRPLSLRPGGRGLVAGVKAVPAAQEGMMARWTWMLVEPVFCFFFSPLSSWDIVPIYPVQRSLCW